MTFLIGFCGPQQSRILWTPSLKNVNKTLTYLAASIIFAAIYWQPLLEHIKIIFLEHTQTTTIGCCITLLSSVLLPVCVFPWVSSFDGISNNRPGFYTSSNLSNCKCVWHRSFSISSSHLFDVGLLFIVLASNILPFFFLCPYICFHMSESS